MATLQENLRLSQPEIEPLNAKKIDAEEGTPSSQRSSWESFSTIQKFRATSKQVIQFHS